MEIQKRQSTTIALQNNSLRTLLKADNSRELVRYVSKLKIQKLYTDRAKVQELEVVLDHLRGRYNQVKSRLNSNLKKVEKDEIQRELKYLETKGNEFKQELEKNERIPTLREMAITNEDDLIADLSLLILDMDESFNIGKSLTPGQIETLSIMIIEQCKPLVLEDIALCFHRAKIGDYGKVYDRLDLNVVFSWINQYKTEMKSIHQMHSESQYSSSKVGISDGRVSDRGENGFQEFKADFVGKQVVKSERIRRKTDKKKTH